MVLTNERAELLSNYLAADKDHAEELLKLSPEEAMVKINADGYDFTTEEIAAFGKELTDSVARMNSGEELDADTLEQVAGGAWSRLAAANLALWALW